MSILEYEEEGKVVMVVMVVSPSAADDYIIKKSRRTAQTSFRSHIGFFKYQCRVSDMTLLCALRMRLYLYAHSYYLL